APRNRRQLAVFVAAVARQNGRNQAGQPWPGRALRPGWTAVTKGGMTPPKAAVAGRPVGPAYGQRPSSWARHQTPFVRRGRAAQRNRRHLAVFVRRSPASAAVP